MEPERRRRPGHLRLRLRWIAGWPSRVRGLPRLLRSVWILARLRCVWVLAWLLSVLRLLRVRGLALLVRCVLRLRGMLRLDVRLDLTLTRARTLRLCLVALALGLGQLILRALRRQCLRCLSVGSWRCRWWLISRLLGLGRRQLGRRLRALRCGILGRRALRRRRNVDRGGDDACRECGRLRRAGPNRSCLTCLS